MIAKNCKECGEPFKNFRYIPDNRICERCEYNKSCNQLLAELKDKLCDAIKAEEYERCAKLRNQILEVEKKIR